MNRQHYRRIVAITSMIGTLCVVPAASPAQTQPPQPTVKTAAPEDPALQAFRKAVDDYVALHRRLRNEVPNPGPNSESREISSSTDVLATAIQRARPKARQGDFFGGEPTRVIKTLVIDTVRGEQLAPVLAGIDDEPPTITTPRIYMKMPGAAQMASMPPSLLQVLPPLPEELEYRIVGTYLVLRDTHAAIVLDYITRAVPRQ
jgi:hypothetical protein